MGWFKTRRTNHVRLTYEGKSTTTTRAMKAENRYFPVIEVKTKLGENRSSEEHEKIDELVIYYDLETAVLLANELLAAIAVATPQMPRSASRIPWE